MLKCSTDICVHQSFSAFEDCLNRKLRLAQVSLDSTVLISIFAVFNMFESFCIVSCCYVALFVAV